MSYPANACSKRLTTVGLRTLAYLLKQSQQCARVLYGVSIAVVVEIGPDPACSACLDSTCPNGQLLRRVIVAIPLLDSVKADVDFVCSRYHLVRQARAATRAENCAGRAKRSIDSLIPPAAVSKFHDIPPGRIQLRKNSVEARARIVKAGRELKEKAAYPRTKEIGDVTKVANQCPRPGEAFDMRDEFRCFDGVNKLPSTHLPDPPTNRCESGPGVEGSV